MKRGRIRRAAVLLLACGLVLLAAGCRKDVSDGVSAVESASSEAGGRLDLSAPEKTLAFFCEAVREGDVELLNALFSEGYLAKYGEWDSLEAAPRFHARETKRYTDDEMREWGCTVDDSRAYFQMMVYDGDTFVGDGGWFGCQYTLVLEEDGWKIEKIGTSF